MENERKKENRRPPDRQYREPPEDSGAPKMRTWGFIVGAVVVYCMKFMDSAAYLPILIVGGSVLLGAILSVSGALTASSYARNDVLAQGQALALCQCGEFTLQSVGDSVCALVTLRGELPGRLLDGRLEDAVAFFPKGGGAVREAALALSVLEEECPPVSGTSASAYAYTMLTNLISGPTALPEKESEGLFSPLVEAAVGIIQEEFPFLEGLDELAQRLEVSKAHLIRCFTKQTGVSPGRYITHLRVEYAKLLLRGGRPLHHLCGRGLRLCQCQLLCQSVPSGDWYLPQRIHRKSASPGRKTVLLPGPLPVVGAEYRTF